MRRALLHQHLLLLHHLLRHHILCKIGDKLVQVYPLIKAVNRLLQHLAQSAGHARLSLQLQLRHLRNRLLQHRHKLHPLLALLELIGLAHAAGLNVQCQVLKRHINTHVLPRRLRADQLRHIIGRIALHHNLKGIPRHIAHHVLDNVLPLRYAALHAHAHNLGLGCRLGLVDIAARRITAAGRHLHVPKNHVRHKQRMVELRNRELLDRCANRLARVDVGRNPLAALIITHMLGQALCIACRQITGLRHNKSRLVVLAAVAHLTAQMAVLILIVNQRLHIAQRVIAPVHLIKHQAKKRIPTLACRRRAIRLARPIIRTTGKRKHMAAALIPHLPHLKQAVIGAVASLNHRLALILAKAFSAFGQLCRGKHALIYLRRHPHPLPNGLGLGIIGQLKHRIIQNEQIFGGHAVNYQAFLHKQF